MKVCPRCKWQCQDQFIQCPRCGLIFNQPPQTRPYSPYPPQPPKPPYPPPQQYPSYPSQPQNYPRQIHPQYQQPNIRCPRCGSPNLQVINEVHGKGVSGTKVCLFGLCGLCGAGKTKNQAFWICQSCGNKFKI